MSAKEIAHLAAEDDRLRQRIDADQKRRREIQLRLSELRCPHPIGMEFVKQFGMTRSRGQRFRVVGHAPCGSWAWRLLASPVLASGKLGKARREFYPYDNITPDPKGDA